MPLSLIYGLLFGTACAEMAVRSAIWPYLAVLLSVAFLKRLAERFTIAVAIMLPVILTRMLLLFSLIFISEKFFIRELGIVASGPVYSAYFALISCAFLHLSAVVFRALSRTAPRQVPLLPLLQLVFVSAVALAALIAVGFLLYTGVTQGFALLDQTDRFQYRANQGWLYGIIITLKPVLAGLMGFARFRLPMSGLAKAFLSWLFMLLVGSSALFGDKFLSLLVMFGYFFAPHIALAGAISPQLRQRVAAIAVVAGILVSGLTYYIYSDYGARDVAQTSDRLFGRFTGQGQLWYAVMDGSPALLAVDHAELNKLNAVMLSPRADQLAFDTRVGIFRMVAQYAPDNIRRSIFNAGGLVQFTGASEAYLTLLFGHVPMLVIMAALAVACGVFSYYVYNALIAGSLPGYFAALFILANFSSMLNQASFWQVFGLKALSYIGIFVFIDLAQRMVLSRRQLRARVAGQAAGPA